MGYCESPQNNSNDLVNLKIYDASGRLVKEFDHLTGQITWDCADESGKALPVGVYFVVLRRGLKTLHEKLIKIK